MQLYSISFSMSLLIYILYNISFSAFEGAGIELTDLLCSALSTLSRLLQLWPLDATKSPIAQTLSIRPVGRTERHLVTTIAQYIYHRVNPQLPRLATQLLTTLASVSDYYVCMSYIICERMSHVTVEI